MPVCECSLPGSRVGYPSQARAAGAQVDEASMLDLGLGAALLDALPRSHPCQLVLVGAPVLPRALSLCLFCAFMKLLDHGPQGNYMTVFVCVMLAMVQVIAY